MPLAAPRAMAPAMPRDRALIYASAAVRGAVVNLSGVLLGVHLARRGFSATEIGAAISLGLGGCALATLAAFYPAELGEKADPFQPAPIGIKPEWYFMFMFQTLKLLPSYILGIEGELVGILAFGAGGLFLALIPFLDRASSRGERSQLFVWIGSAIILYMLVLTYLGYTMSATK